MSPSTPRHVALVAGLLLCAALPTAQAEEKRAMLVFTSVEDSRTEHERVVAPFVARHCQACHSADNPEGELNLVALETDMKASASAARWAVVLDKLAHGEMPPEDEPRPDKAAAQAVMTWIQAEMKRANKRIAHRQEYANGNKIAHELLFAPQAASPFDIPARVRRLSPEQYEGFTNELAKGANGIGQPFSSDPKSTFRDMGAPKVDEPITVQLLNNALLIVERQTAHTIENGQVKAVGFSPKELLKLFDEQNPPDDEQIATAIKWQFDRVLRRQPTADELARFTALMRANIEDAGRTTGVRYTLAAVFLLPEAVFRWELGSGELDDQGRVRLEPREIAFALAYALTDRRPEGWLLSEAEKGGLDTREGVEAAARRMLDDPKLDKPRILRFFREYFGYHRATEVFKNDKDNPEHDARILVEDTDRLVQEILAEDKHVFRELLTTNKSFVAYKSAAETKKKRAEELAKFEEAKNKEPEKYKNKKPPKVGRSIYEAYNLADFPDQQPVELPKQERAGILTQPAWLVAYSQSEDNHVILRGKWVRERLLGGVVPDIPITVDAQLPIAPEKTLRERLEVTRQAYCWKCHQSMNPVGLPFEAYDHFGRFRIQELEKPVDASGHVDSLGGQKPEADVKNAVEMLRQVAASERAEQVFVRHAFRYWMGRNETLGDASSLQAAHRAYRENDGSMKALIVALLTSDSFLYRVPAADHE